METRDYLEGLAHAQVASRAPHHISLLRFFATVELRAFLATYCIG
ncbi:hypothetical protein CCACVL1_10479 [Corchorus capsularis]|uniref:Uncharacterized protein n=1 Tax=Corchorus capsularis TaxID=210143 RepID=A0A1R3IR20_COCAP|nr:hypothetical protein CCACVL1_10479 [Corchorus capsularis]